jgi:hypothetical protein
MSTDRANPSLWIGLLGPPEVSWAGATLSIVRRQTRALLYRLAMHLSTVLLNRRNSQPACGARPTPITARIEPPPGRPSAPATSRWPAKHLATPRTSRPMPLA